MKPRHQLTKSPHLLVYPSHQGWEILHRLNRQKKLLPENCKHYWDIWDMEKLERVDHALMLNLIRSEMIIPKSSCVDLTPMLLDSYSPEISPRYVKSYAESSDTVILFNTGGMPENNPLLVLGPYGSLCWNNLMNRKTIRQIREDAVRVFNADEVLPFLLRLIHTGFLSPLPLSGTINAVTVETVTKEFPANLVQYELPRSQIPWYVLWEVCTQCDLRCRTCYLPQFDSFGRSNQQIIHCAQHLVESEVFYISLFGGEVLLRNDLEEIVSFLRHNDVFVKVISNGQQLSYDRAKSLAEAGLNMLEISFDGLSEELHDSSRGIGTFDKAYRAVKFAQEAGIPRQAIVWTVHSENYSELERMPQFLDAIGVTECYISTFKKTGMNGVNAPWQPLSFEQSVELQRYVAEISREKPHLTITVPTNCSCGRTSIVISPEENVRLCTFSPVSVGSLQSDSFKAVWKMLNDTCSGIGPHGYCAKPLC